MDAATGVLDEMTEVLGLLIDQAEIAHKAPPTAPPRGPLARFWARLTDDAHRRFWVFQFAIWGVYFCVRTLLAIAIGTTFSGLGVRLMVTLTGFLITYLMWRVLRTLIPGGIGRQITFLIGLSFIGAIILGNVEMIGQFALDGKWAKVAALFREHGYLSAWAKEAGWQSFQNMWVLIAWGGIYLGFDYSKRLQEERLHTAEAKSLAHEAQLKMLRYQLNPHFLFNTLNALSALVLTKENDRAEKMLIALSKFLRHTLDSDPLTKVPLSREMWALGLYLDIEKERFSDRLTIEKKIDQNALDCLMPSLLLQPLIENALKYAVARSCEGGTITISAHRRNGYLEISIADDGPGIKEPIIDTLKKHTSGVGLRNTMGRLERIYGGQAGFDIKNRRPIGLEITLRLPAECCDDTDTDDAPQEED